jgi:hypothetical protein
MVLKVKAANNDQKRVGTGTASRPKRPTKADKRTAGKAGNWVASFESRTDLTGYGDNALGLFALAMRFNIDDLQSVAANSITDGSDDKKCDIIYVDKDNGIAVIAQCYKAFTPKEAAPSNKASDLNTAVSWVMQRPLDELPERIRTSAAELRGARVEIHCSRDTW